MGADQTHQPALHKLTHIHDTPRHFVRHFAKSAGWLALPTGLTTQTVQSL
eukprot:NODE_6388_length_203_cov_50.032468_g5717_i0.p3 GENE.NODE_6388_length_203_cov_50.032468_g5717_i0~~NODE_6388_length_203_cov_50.032468_g5717_i0.p3  ORF type:complete len:50 (+),score=4.17 NODE_6388_length_203_cov_50.032468_g5717_i0:34-183(+)